MRPVPAAGLVAALLALVLLGDLATAQGLPTPFNNTVLFSELHRGQAGSPSTGIFPFKYIELVNTNISTPLPIGGVQVRVTTPTVIGLSQAFQAGTVIQPGGTALITQAAFPVIAGIPPGTPVLQDSAFFSNPAILSTNLPNALCLLHGPSATVLDYVELNGPGTVASPCGISQPFFGILPFSFGHVNRVLYVHSKTFYDYDPGVPPSGLTAPQPSPGTVTGAPGTAQDQMNHVDGFIFGSSLTGTGAIIPTTSIPPPVPTPTAGMLAQGQVAGTQPLTAAGGLNLTGIRVIAVNTPKHPRFNRISDPVFDRVIFNPASPSTSATVSVSAPVFAQDALLGNCTLPNMLWSMNLPSPLQPGILSIPMVNTTQQAVGVSINQGLGRPRIERVLSDLSPDSTASGSGDMSGVQIDVLPGSTGGGDLWCDVIVYDENGFSYRAKVRNWPSTVPGCTTPNLGLGSNVAGNLDIIAICFTPQPTLRELYILPTLSVAGPLGGGPFFGITPDGLTFSFLTLPLGAAPGHVQATIDGIYFYSITIPVGFSGLMLDMVAIEWDPVLGFTQFSPAAEITIL